jgi:hypothetical protein
MQDYTRACNKYRWVSVRCEHRRQGMDVRQAGRAFDAGEESADEDGIKAEMYEFSEHFRVAHNDGWMRRWVPKCASITCTNASNKRPQSLLVPVLNDHISFYYSRSLKVEEVEAYRNFTRPANVCLLWHLPNTPSQQPLAMSYLTPSTSTLLQSTETIDKGAISRKSEQQRYASLSYHA